jgi:NitT/TauT family transport system substrate-binding protein
MKENYDAEIVKRFVEATLEAWNYAFDHPDKSIELVKEKMNEFHVPFNKSHQTWMFNRINDLFNVPGKKYKQGELLREDFEKAYKIFSSLGKINKDFTFNEFYFGIK